MRSILVLGAGRSAPALVRYLRQEASNGQWQVFVGDLSLAAASRLAGDESHALTFDVADVILAREVISRHNVVVSLLPPAFQVPVAALCLELGKSFFCASYASREMEAMDHEVKEKGLLFLNECGLDPGIDHMSAMKLLQAIRGAGGAIESFESFTGGLIAKTTDPGNPWRYKFTWNPGNVVTAGHGTACYLRNGSYQYLPHNRLFRESISLTMPDGEPLEAYANRDSLRYLQAYGLEGVATMLRGTLRYPGFCAAWDALVQLGCCDDSYALRSVDKMTHRGFVESFLPPGNSLPEDRLSELVRPESRARVLKCLTWSGFFDDTLVGLETGTPAQVLQMILNKRWAMQPGDSDRVVMLHRIRYGKEGKYFECTSGFSAEGEPDGLTAMATTVGLPLAMAVELFLKDKIKVRGVQLPVTAEFYEPILQKLEGTVITTDAHTAQLSSHRQ